MEASNKHIEIEKPGETQYVKSLELIFEVIPCLSESKYSELRDLTLISTSPLAISSLAISNYSLTLTTLHLIKQNLSSMDYFQQASLVLPNLTELSFQENQIKEIQGLESCPALKRLILTSNQLKSLKGLKYAQRLRVLWVQDNDLRDLEGMGGNGLLTDLQLAGNPCLWTFEVLKPLKILSCLRMLRIADDNFSSRVCGIVGTEHYFEQMLELLPQLLELDGEPASSEKRLKLGSDVLLEKLEFQEQLEDLRQEHSEKMSDLTRDYMKYKQRTQKEKMQVIHAFAALEKEVLQGCMETQRVFAESFAQKKAQVEETIEGLEAHKQRYCEVFDQFEEKYTDSALSKKINGASNPIDLLITGFPEPCIVELCNRAALNAARDGIEFVDLKDILSEINRAAK